MYDVITPLASSAYIRKNTRFQTGMGDVESCVDLWADVAETRNKSNRTGETKRQHDGDLNNQQHQVSETDSRVSSTTTPSLTSNSHLNIREAQHEARRGTAIRMTARRSASMGGTKIYNNGSGSHPARVFHHHPHPHPQPSRQQYHRSASMGTGNGIDISYIVVSHPRSVSPLQPSHQQQQRSASMGTGTGTDNSYSNVTHPTQTRVSHHQPPSRQLQDRRHLAPGQHHQQSTTGAHEDKEAKRYVSQFERLNTRGAGSFRPRERLQPTVTPRRTSQLSNRNFTESANTPGCQDQHEEGQRTPRLPFTRHASSSMSDLYEKRNDPTQLNGKLQRRTGTTTSVGISNHSRHSTKSAPSRQRLSIGTASSTISLESMKSTGTPSVISNLSQESMKSKQDPRSELTTTTTTRRAKLPNSSNHNHGQESNPSTKTRRNSNDRRSPQKEESRTIRRMSVGGSMLNQLSQHESNGRRSSLGDARKLTIAQESSVRTSPTPSSQEEDSIGQAELKEPKKWLFNFPAKGTGEEKKEKHFPFRRLKTR